MSNETKNQKNQKNASNATPANAPLPSDGKEKTNAEFKAFVARVSAAIAAGNVSVQDLETLKTMREKQETEARVERGAKLRGEVETLASKYGIDLTTLATDVAGYAGLIVRAKGDTSKPRGKQMSAEAKAEEEKVLNRMAIEAAKKAAGNAYIESTKILARECGVDSSRVVMVKQKLEKGKLTLPTV